MKSNSGSSSQLFFRNIRKFLTVYLIEQRGYSLKTVDSYKLSLNQFLEYLSKNGNIKLSQIDYSSISKLEVESFLSNGEKQGWTVNTRNLKLSAVKSFLKFSANENLELQSVYLEIMSIPAKKSPERAVEYFTEYDLKLLLNQPDVSKQQEFRDLVIMSLLYDTACRISELIGIKLKDLYINEKAPYIKVYGKGGKLRLVPVMDNTVSLIRRYIEIFHPQEDAYDSSSNPLFYVNRYGQKNGLHPDTIQKMINKYVKRCQSLDDKFPKRIYCHMFRHSRATHLYRNGMPITLVSEWLGHSQIETTRKFYAQADLSMKMDAIKKASKNLEDVLISNREEQQYDFDDDETLKKLYGLT